MEKVIIYIIITIILIAVSVRNSKKQQQAKLEQLNRQKKLQEEQTETSEDSLEEIFRKLGGDIFGADQQLGTVIAQAPEAPKKHDPFSDVKLKRIEKSKSFGSKDKSSSPRGKRIYQEEVFDEIGVEKSFDYELNTEEDFKKAIVYSEIMNRKYV